MTVEGALDAIGPRPEETNVPPVLPQLIYYTLRIGVGIAAALILLGVGLLVAGSTASFTTATEQGSPFSLAGLANGLAGGRAAEILLLGFLVLILTPLIRVVFSVLTFAVARDRAFTVLTVTVLALIGASVLVGAFP